MSLWHFITRLGEAQILLPAAIATTLLLAFDPKSRPLALRWWLALLVATLITTASKVAYMGWGLGGSTRWNFTGISGHAMFSSAIYPMLLSALAGFVSGREQRYAAWCGAGLAMLIGYSRIMVHAHSPAEVIAGLLVGGAATWVTWHPLRLQQWRFQPWWSLTLSAWLAAGIAWAPQPTTHQMVQSFSRWLSGHPRAFTRQDLQNKASTPISSPDARRGAGHPFS
jgi:membrane-associated phospholipid phosphatase